MGQSLEQKKIRQGSRDVIAQAMWEDYQQAQQERES